MYSDMLVARCSITMLVLLMSQPFLCNEQLPSFVKFQGELSKIVSSGEASVSPGDIPVAPELDIPPAPPPGEAGSFEPEAKTREELTKRRAKLIKDVVTLLSYYDMSELSEKFSQNRNEIAQLLKIDEALGSSEDHLIVCMRVLEELSRFQWIETTKDQYKNPHALLRSAQDWAYEKGKFDNESESTVKAFITKIGDPIKKMQLSTLKTYARDLLNRWNRINNLAFKANHYKSLIEHMEDSFISSKKLDLDVSFGKLFKMKVQRPKAGSFASSMYSYTKIESFIKDLSSMYDDILKNIDTIKLQLSEATLKQIEERFKELNKSFLFRSEQKSGSLLKTKSIEDTTIIEALGAWLTANSLEGDFLDGSIGTSESFETFQKKLLGDFNITQQYLEGLMKDYKTSLSKKSPAKDNAPAKVTSNPVTTMTDRIVAILKGNDFYSKKMLIRLYVSESGFTVTSGGYLEKDASGIMVKKEYTNVYEENVRTKDQEKADEAVRTWYSSKRNYMEQALEIYDNIQLLRQVISDQSHPCYKNVYKFFDERSSEDRDESDIVAWYVDNIDTLSKAVKNCRK